MTAYLDTVMEHLRLTILRLLAKQPGYSANESILTDASQHVGVSATRDQVKAQIAWLQEQALVTTEDLDGFIVATVTARGVEVSEGKASHPGVKRPSPK